MGIARIMMSDTMERTAPTVLTTAVVWSSEQENTGSWTPSMSTMSLIFVGGCCYRRLESRISRRGYSVMRIP